MGKSLCYFDIIIIAIFLNKQLQIIGFVAGLRVSAPDFSVALKMSF